MISRLEYLTASKHVIAMLRSDFGLAALFMFATATTMAKGFALL